MARAASDGGMAVMGVIDHDKLAAVLGMMGSRHDGEALTAARQAERMRANAGMTWAEIIAPGLPAPVPIRSIADAIALVLDHDELLTDWEADFIRSVSAQSRPLSEKQISIIDRLVEKVQRAGRVS